MGKMVSNKLPSINTQNTISSTFSRDNSTSKMTGTHQRAKSEAVRHTRIDEMDELTEEE